MCVIYKMVNFAVKRKRIFSITSLFVCVISIWAHRHVMGSVTASMSTQHHRGLSHTVKECSMGLIAMNLEVV